MTGKSSFCESQKEQDEVLAELRALVQHVEQMESFCPTCGSADIEEQTWVRCVTQEVVGGDVGDYMWCRSCAATELDADFKTADTLRTHFDRWKSRHSVWASWAAPLTPLPPEAVLQNLLEACERQATAELDASELQDADHITYHKR